MPYRLQMGQVRRSWSWGGSRTSSRKRASRAARSVSSIPSDLTSGSGCADSVLLPSSIGGNRNAFTAFAKVGFSARAAGFSQVTTRLLLVIHNSDRVENVNQWDQTQTRVDNRLDGSRETCAANQFVILVWSIVVVTLNSKGRTTQLFEK